MTDQASAPLPAGWAEYADPSSGKSYYHNASTGETTWDRPGGGAALAQQAAQQAAQQEAQQETQQEASMEYAQQAAQQAAQQSAQQEYALAAMAAVGYGQPGVLGGFAGAPQGGGGYGGGYDLGAGGGQFSGDGLAAVASSLLAAQGGGMAHAPGMKQGTVKAWFEEKGFGFIAPSEGGDDVFVHRNNLEDGQMLVQDAVVSFMAEWNPRANRNAVTRCVGAVPGSGGKGKGKGSMGSGKGGGGAQAGGMAGGLGGDGAPGSLAGTVKVWFEEKGFGFITPSIGGEDIFVHRSVLGEGMMLMQGATVSYTTAWNAQKNKMAVNSCSGAVQGGGSGGGGKGGGCGGGYGKASGCFGQVVGDRYAPYAGGVLQAQFGSF